MEAGTDGHNFERRPPKDHSSWYSELLWSYTHTWPAPTIIIISILIFYQQIFTFSIRVYFVVIVFLQMRINNGNHLPSFRSHIVNHVYWVWKFIAIPCEISMNQKNKMSIRVSQLVEYGEYFVFISCFGLSWLRVHEKLFSELNVYGEYKTNSLILHRPIMHKASL